MNKRSSLRLLTAALGLSLGLAASAFAMPRGEHPGPHTGMTEHHMTLHMRSMQRLHDDLKLDEKQEALWKEADSFARETMPGMRERFRTHHEEIAAQLNQPNADLRALAKRMDDFRADRQKQHEAVRDRWLAVYDALNPEQKAKARLYFKAKLDRGMERHGHGHPMKQRAEPHNAAPKS